MDYKRFYGLGTSLHTPSIAQKQSDEVPEHLYVSWLGLTTEVRFRVGQPIVDEQDIWKRCHCGHPAAI